MKSCWGAAIAAIFALIPSGVALAQSAEPPEPAHFHHVRLNVTDPEKSMKFYQRVFGGTPVRFQNAVDAVFTERSFLLFNKVDAPPPSELRGGIWHIGWGGVDVMGEYAWWSKRGVEFHTTPQPLPGKDNHYMYIYGPDKELIEVNTMGHHRYAHVHLFATDVNATAQWYADHLGQRLRRRDIPKPTGDPATLGGIWMNSFQCDNVTVIIFGKPDQDPPPPWWRDPPLKEFEPSKGRAIDHLAFSYRDIGPVFERMKVAGVEIAEPIAWNDPLKIKSFFVIGPEKVLIEIVEAKPIPEGLWDEAK